MYFAYLVYIAILFIIGTVLIRWIQTQIAYIKIINKIPGPPTTPILGNVREILCSAEQLWLNLRRLSKEHYPIYKLWACHVSNVFITLPEDVEILISSTKHLTKSPIYDCFHAWLGTGLLTSTGNKWHVRRKLLTPAFHFNILKQFLMVFSETSDLLVNELEAECTKPSTDIVPHISKFTLNTICETAMGAVPEELDENEENYRSGILEMGRFIVYRVMRPWMYNNLMFLLTTTFWKQRKLSNLLHLFSLNVITKRRNTTEKFLDTMEIPDEGEVFGSQKKRLAMLDLLLSAQNSGIQLNDEDIREEVDTFMFEGHDTTSMSICSTLMLLACHQDIQERVREEVRNVTKNSHGRFSYEDLQELKYLEMVLKESLRMYPSVPFISRQTSEDIVTYSGYTIPNDTSVNVLIYDIHHNPLYYPNPEKFDPDRFSLENSKNRHPFAYIPFSAGPRNCIGQRFAILELKMVVAKILQRFYLHPVDTPDTITMTTDILLRTTNGVRIKLERIHV